jgi:putative spermidine/putrescine transport system substrate-binding protein
VSPTMRAQRALVACLATVLAASLGLGIVGCGGGRVKSWHVHGLGSTLNQIQHRARDEGALDLVVRPGFPTRLPTATFTRQTGCEVSTTHSASADLVSSSATRHADGVLAAGDSMLRLIDSGAVAPVNYGLVPSYRDVVPGLRGQIWDRVDGTGYAVPQGRVANLELFRNDYLPSATTSWTPMWSPSLRGHISVYNAPIFIADAALYLQATRPSLHITNPYELDGKQFAVVARLLRRQRRDVGEYWSAATIRAQVASFSDGNSLVGTTWPRQVRLLNAEQPPVPITSLKPVEGTTGWADAWMISARPKHPNCLYLWLDYIVSPEANAREAQLFAEAPANVTACEVAADDSFCTDTHADDDEWWKDVRMWTVPQKDCGDARGAVCKTHADWQKAWAAIRTRRRT